MQKPHAVVVLPNVIQIDARAHRNAMALAAAGYQVTIVGWGTGIPETGTIAGVPYVLCNANPKAAGGTTRPDGKKKLSFTYRAVRKAFHLTMGRRPPTKVLKVVARVDSLNDGAKRAAKRMAKEAQLLAERAKPQTPVIPPPPPEVQEEGGPIDWREALPHVPVMVENMFNAVLHLRPDVIVTDVHLMPLAAGVARRSLAQGHPVGTVYDAREYVYGLASDDPNVTEGFPALEAEFMDQMDAVFTVCQPIADFLAERYNLETVPPLVPNAPIYHLPETERPMTIRDFLTIPADAPLLAYAGGLSYHRGVHDVVVALADLPGVHLALGARRESSYTVELERLAKKHGVFDRLHFVPFSPGHEVAQYLSSATAAIFPFLPVGNHVWAAPNKYFESIQARLPVLTSNMEWLGEQVTRLGIGEVFEHSNPASVVEATRKVLDNLETYRARITDEVVAEHSFERFAGVVQDVCKAVTAPRALTGLKPTSLEEQLGEIRRDGLGMRAELADSEIFGSRPWLRIGNTNSAGQPLLWATALMRSHPEVIAESTWLNRGGGYDFPVNQTVTEHQWHAAWWQRNMMRKLENRVTHVLSESGRPVVGTRFGPYFYSETKYLKSIGVTQGLVFHGSDIRNPRIHAELEPDSPFADPDEELQELTEALQRRVDQLTPHVLAFKGPVYVTTNDLLDYLPRATWLPVVVDTDSWQGEEAPLASDAPPLVFHVPSKQNGLKGSEVIDEVCERLQAEGRIRYFRATGLTRAQMREHMLEADIVIDQLRLGDYGVTAVEAMSAGRIVIGHVSERVRQRIDSEVPIVEATVDTLPEVLEGVLEDKERAAQLSRAGREFALKYHDGTASAKVLADFMGL